MTQAYWAERYRPDNLDDVALAPELREQFKRYLDGEVLPRSLILHGPSGVGKSTIAKIIAEVPLR